MKKILISIVAGLTFISCDRPACNNTNPIFNNYSPSSPEYKKELINQLRNTDQNDLSYWFDKYIEKSGNEYLQFYIQGKEICAKGLMKVETWTDEIENIKRVKGKSYERAEFLGLIFVVEEDGDEIELLYKSTDRIID